ncbi:hypothetical protein M9H77_02474 [Catharanthus roseus]|uniref:Uncharacterized protein n=1 Tax=Catharanthus roseus TaxID=4058 RepID=A0ACC0C8H7_CATRO|nr:hypothetical protein M9H77_02474 [Catharanthus roseus]
MVLKAKKGCPSCSPSVQFARIKQGNTLEKKMAKFWHAANLFTNSSPWPTVAGKFLSAHLRQTRPLLSLVGSTLPLPLLIKGFTAILEQCLLHKRLIRWVINSIVELAYEGKNIQHGFKRSFDWLGVDCGRRVFSTSV